MKLKILILLIAAFATVNSMAKEAIRYHRYSTSDGLTNNNATTFAQDKEGYIWIGSRSGLCRFDGSHFKQFSISSTGEKIGWIRKIRIDKDGRTLIMKINDGDYVKFNPSTLEITELSTKLDLETQELPESILSYDSDGMKLNHKGSTYHVPYIGNPLLVGQNCENFIDRQGNFWVNFDNAVYQISFSDFDFSIYNNVGDAAGTTFSSDVRSIKRLRDGSLIVGVKSNHVVRYSKDGKFSGYLNKQGQWQTAPAEYIGGVYSIEEDQQGRVWLALRNDGIVCLDNPCTNAQKQYFYQKKDVPQLPTDKYFEIHQSEKSGLLWFGSWGNGVAVINTAKKDFSPENLQKSILSVDHQELLKVRRIRELGDTVALCTTTGLYFYQQNGKFISHVGDIDISDVVRVDGKLYVGSYSQGLYILNGKDKLEQYDIAGLSDCIYSITLCKDNQLLFTNPECLLLYDTKRGTVRYFDNKYFGENVSFSEIKPFIEGNTLYSGLSGAYIRVNLDTKAKGYIPNIHIEQAGEAVSIGGKIAVRPSILDFRIPRMVSFAWREKGEEEWHYEAGDDKEVVFSWYMPGKHIVEFRSTDAMGIWVDNNTEAEFNVTPSAWQWGVILFLAVLVAVIVWLAWKVNHPKLIQTSDTAVDTAVDIFPSAPDVTPYDRQLAQKMVENIERSISNSEYDVEQLATDMGMSRSQLYVQCKEALEKTPAVFILEIRMKRAMQLMENHSLRINEIAYRVGFSDPKYFAKVFKKHVGVTPSQYAESKKEQG